MGWTPKETFKVLFYFRALFPRPRYSKIGEKGPKRYPASVTEDLRRLARLPFEEIDPQSDWLARYIKEGPHGTDREGRSSER